MAFFGLFGLPDVEKLKAKRNVKGLIKTLHYKQDKLIRKKAAIALGEIRPRQAVEPLIKALQDEDRDVRKAAVIALGEIKDTRSVEPLVIALIDEDVFVREKVVLALGQLRDKRAVEPLIVALKNEDQSYRREAIILVLGQIRDTRAVEPLVAILSQGKSTRVTIEALEQIGGVRAFGPLIEVGIRYDSQTTNSVLQRMLKLSASEISIENLRKVTQLRDTAKIIAPAVCDFPPLTEGTDYSRLRQLARQELIRRGEEA